jgi:hypothetical protein
VCKEVVDIFGHYASFLSVYILDSNYHQAAIATRFQVFVAVQM